MNVVEYLASHYVPLLIPALVLLVVVPRLRISRFWVIASRVGGLIIFVLVVASAFPIAYLIMHGAPLPGEIAQ